MLAAVTALGVGCPSANTCISGATQLCVCTATQMGAQTCSASGTWNACECDAPGEDAGTPDAAMEDAFFDPMLDAFTPDAPVDPMIDAHMPLDGGMEVATSMTIGPAGGELTLEGATLTVPAGALPVSTELRMIATMIPGPAGYTLYSPVFRFEPAGTTFAMPVTIRMPYDGNRARAALFWSQADGHWERVGGVPDATHVVGQITHFSDGFTADGVDYTEAPGTTCSVTRAWASNTMRPSALGIMFTAFDCDGRPVTGLTAADVEIREDDLLLGSETPLTLEAINNPEVTINLAFDMSASTAPLLPDVIAGAQAFIDRLREVGARPSVRLSVFDGTAGTEWEPFTRDLDRVRTRIGELGMYVPADPASTNLFEGARSSLFAARGRTNGLRTDAANGVEALSFSVLFTDGSDTTRAITEASVITAIGSGADMVFGIGLRSPSYDGAALRRIAPNGVIDSPDRTTLPREMARVAAMIDDVVQSTYTVRYCTPKRAGTHVVAMGLVRSAEDRTTAPSVSLVATDFIAGCTATSLANACDRAACGGLFCGGCASDDGEICNGAHGTPNYLVQLNQCRNLNVPCESTGQDECDGACISLDYNPMHCGACGHACEGTQSCFAGACVERHELTMTGLGSTDSVGVSGGPISGIVYLTVADRVSGTSRLWRAARRPGATPTLLGTNLQLMAESPTHAYFIGTLPSGTASRIAYGSDTPEALTTGRLPNRIFWVSADEYLTLTGVGIERFNVVTGASSVEVSSSRWSSIGSAFVMADGGVYVYAGTSRVVYWVPNTGDIRYLGPAADFADTAGRIIVNLPGGTSRVLDGPRGISHITRSTSLGFNSPGNERGWFMPYGFLSFRNGTRGLISTCSGSSARGCVYGATVAAPHTIGFDLHVCEHGEACPGSDVCCPNPTGNDFCAPSCS